jgi:hypothetical protein
MTPETPNADKELRKQLEAFVVDNSDLERLESLVTQFNIFEAVGAVRQELRHSDFLAYLLSPIQNHGLGDAFVRKLLQRVVSLADEAQVPVSQIDLDTWNLLELDVSREWQNIDIMLRSEANHFVVMIENKIDTTEHSGQLQRYWQAIRTQFPNDRILSIYLTPDGEKSSHEASVSVDYEQVANVIEGLVESRGSSLGSDIRVLMAHYTQMLRRHVVTESEIAELCRRIYRKHAQAIDLIIEHRPDQQAMLRELLEQLVKSRPEFVLDHSSKQYVRFAFKDWDIPMLKAGQGWTRSGRMLLFEFQNLPESLRLKLIIGPGPRETREKLLQIVLQNQPPFKPLAKILNRLYNEIYAHNFLSAKAYSEATEKELEDKIREYWKHFLETDLPLLAKFKWNTPT